MNASNQMEDALKLCVLVIEKGMQVRLGDQWPALKDLIPEALDAAKSALNRNDMTNERKNITQPSDWWAAFEEQAKAEGMTLAAWLGEAAKAKLPPKVAKKLTERPPANRPPKAKD
jgi:hypothetical protein